MTAVRKKSQTFHYFNALVNTPANFRCTGCAGLKIRIEHGTWTVKAKRSGVVGISRWKIASLDRISETFWQVGKPYARAQPGFYCVHCAAAQFPDVYAEMVARILK